MTGLEVLGLGVSEHRCRFGVGPGSRAFLLVALTSLGVCIFFGDANFYQCTKKVLEWHLHLGNGGYIHGSGPELLLLSIPVLLTIVAALRSHS